ncbi:MAG: 4-(cytidine 5'-diphospho)-2-C-methyl-D-erythritol kinase [Clostridia bacterium]|nr:4-(cytidine 5'-diphospho)-2-C-methyl-D-erythritol kinase [Clostridia bacterium]
MSFDLRITLPAYAKINLYLSVKERREDGYHNIESIMHTVSLHDTVTVTTEAGDGNIFVASDSGELDCGETNLAYRAADAFFRAGGFGKTPPSVSIFLEKRIPTSAGLAGGSSDCAAVLRALNIISGRAFSSGGLDAIGKSLGADVPFCLHGGSITVRGIGEILSPAAPLPDVNIVICRPNEGISTSGAYRKIDELPEIPPYPTLKSAISALEAGDLASLSECAYNMFELIIPPESNIFKAKRIMNECGAAFSLMSGSGSSVFGVFERAGDAALAAKRLSGGEFSVFECSPVAKI